MSTKLCCSRHKTNKKLVKYEQVASPKLQIHMTGYFRPVLTLLLHRYACFICMHLLHLQSCWAFRKKMVCVFILLII